MSKTYARRKGVYTLVESGQSKNDRCRKKKGKSIDCQVLQRSVARERHVRSAKTLQRSLYPTGKERAESRGGGAGLEKLYSW